MVMSHGGLEESPGPLPAVKVVRHVTPTKSPPTPSVVRKQLVYIHTAASSSRNLKPLSHHLPVAVSPG